jgi:pyruvate/2-oxoglutarate dehydrogenase complex dihydrolipoamide dehydrogenase (E3) component
VDQHLLAHVRPPDWRNPEAASLYDLVVIGGGTAGLVSAAGAAGLGARVALVARALHAAGIRILTGVTLREAGEAAGRAVGRFDGGDVSADAVLVAAGRIHGS